jgi:5-hydroxyisourate hydrolase-like protein (transthyretin family)
MTGRIAPANSGVPVSLQRKVGNDWKTVASTRSTTGGAYSVGAKASSEGRWTVRTVVSSARGNLPGASAARTLTVRTPTRVSLSVSPSSVLAGHKYKIRGTARPHKKGVKVTLQRRTSTGWAKVATTRTSAKGTFTFKRKAGAAGTTVYRVVVASWSFKAAGVSPARTLTVRSPAPPPAPTPPAGGGGGGTGIGGGGGTGIG